MSASVTGVSYRLLMRLLPSKFRDEFGDELLAVFEEVRGESDGLLLCLDLLMAALRLRLLAAPIRARQYGVLDGSVALLDRRPVPAWAVAIATVLTFALFSRVHPIL